MIFKQSLFLILAFASKQALAATGFRYQDNASCESPVSLSVDSFACGGEEDGDDVCNFGGSLEVTGTLSATEDFPEQSCLTLKTCFMGINFFCRSYTETANLCESLQLQSTDGARCPSAGEYTFTGNMKIPSPNLMNLGSGWWLTTDVTVDDCESGYQYTTCSASFKAVSSSSSTAAFVGLSAVGLAALIGALYQRKRRVGRINLSKEEELLQSGQSISGFEMMSEGTRV
ncbi:hypothetical protein FisN_15Hh240 [Fistulifera solaris]|uniref:Uncharacterized protein n=1 Tax=Fistulifera solaris TaxID=1519565 RepID=A0A1Z5JG78_FISSO|nr:hypothetical protein FisN_15Hh240 [Fistulifera solaris]|eukprot:GAX12761.1 hypothetical protein FisN_15Hh240 [Fistulifera solaris]